MAKTIGIWTLQILIGVMFVLLGVGKFQDPTWVRNFARWGYPDGFHMVAGVLEALGGVGLLIPRFTTYAAVLLMVIMAAAALTHVVFGEMQRFPVPVVYMLLCGLVGWLRRRSALRARPTSSAREAVV